MKDQEIKIDVKEGVTELVILHGEAEKVYHPKAIDVKDASIEAAQVYLNKKVVKEDLIENSKIEFSYDGLFINLFYAARERNIDTICGKLKIHPDLEKFSINGGKHYSTFELSDFIKMNRHYFENKDYAMKLVAELRAFEGKVNKDVEAKADTRANSRILINQVVETNIPDGFVLLLPVFVGQDKIRLNVEINITADFSCSLISPDLKEYIDLQAKEIIDGQINAIKQLHPQLKIFEL